MADINVDVNLPNAISVDVTSPTYDLNANVYIPGAQGPRGEKGNPTTINNLSAENIIITGSDGNIVYNTGLNTIFISGNSGYFQSAVNSLRTNLNVLSGLFTGHTGNLNASYATDVELASTGSALNTKIDNLSGYVNSQDTNISNNLVSTGSFLQSNINTLSSNLNSTGSNLENKITSLSGNLTGNYLTTNVASNTYATINNLNSTGNTLNSSISSLSGTLTSNYATISNLNLTGSTLQSNINTVTSNLITTGNTLQSNISTVSSNLISTGNTLEGKISSLSGTLTSNYATITNLASTGSTLASSINSLNSSFTGFTGNLDATYATDSQLSSTGTTLVNSISSLSGTLTSNYATITNLNSTGNTLNSSIASLSGLFTGYTGTLDATFASDTQLSNTGITLNNSITSLSGTLTGNYLTTSSASSTYATIVNVSSTGVTLNNSINSLSGTLTGNYATILNLANTGSTLNNSIISLSGLFTGYTGTLDATFATDLQLSSTGTTLNNTINSLSGTVTGNYVTKSNGQFTNRPTVNGTGILLSGEAASLPTTILYTTGYQIISGNKSFYGDVLLTGNNNIIGKGYYLSTNSDFVYIRQVDGRRILDSEELSLFDTDENRSIDWGGRYLYDPNGAQSIGWDTRELLNKNTIPVLTWTGNNIGIGTNTPSEKLEVAGNIIANNLVYNTGNQTISGNKTFDVAPVVSGNPFITGNLSLYATTTNLASTGSTLNSRINSLSGTLTGNYLTTSSASSIYATITNLASTGSTLNSNINSLSGLFTGYTGTLDATFASDIQLANTGSGLLSSINSLSGTLTGNYLTSSSALNTYATISNLSSTGSTLTTNLASTGSTLVTSINSLSGTLTGNYVTKNNGLFTNRPTVNGTNILLSGESIISGDLTGSLPLPTIDKLQGYKLDLNGGAADGQVLQWNAASSSWRAGAVPAGGNGGGGLVYYFDFANRSGIAPTGGLPTTGDHALSLLGTQYVIGSGQATSNELDPRFTDKLLCSFVTASGNPGALNIPAGLWDFNIWANVDNASTTQCSIKVVVNIYNPTNSTYRYLASSDDVYLYETSTIAQYILNATVPQTGIASNERIYIQLFGKKYTTNNRNITIYFDSYRPCHVHTTIPSIAGDGVVKVVNGVFQTPATGIFNADVDNNANIAQSKIANLATDLTTIRNTGTFLDGKINSLSGTLTSTYATITNLASTGNTLVTNLASTGSTLDTKINTLSGYVTGTNSTFTTNLASTGSTLNTRINNLSGYINSTSSNIVFTTGNQTISGIKSFAQDTTFGDSAQGDFLVISGNNFTVYGSGNFTSGLFVNGNAVLTGVNLSSYATTANLANTGSTLDTKINNLSGVSVLTFGNQTINGLKTFTSGIDIYSGTSPQSLRIFNSTGTNSGEFALIGWRNNEFVIGSQRTTSGILRDVTLTGANINLSPSGTVIIKGNINVTGSGIFSNGSVSAISLLNNPLSVVGSGNSYVQLNIQNRASGTTATADLVITANNGTDNSNFINLGINNSGYNDPAFSNGSGLDGYLFVNGGSLDIGTQTSGTHIEFHVEGTTLDKVVGRFTSSGLDLNNSNLINATPQIINLSANFNISGNYNSRMIMVNSANEVTGRIVSGNSLGFNAGITQVGAGKIFITGSGIGITIGSYNNQYRTAGQFATVSVLHTGNNGYVIYGNTAL